MDSHTLVELAPLVQGRLKDQRQEICLGYVQWAIYSEYCPEEFEVSDVRQILKEYADIVLEEIQVISALDALIDRLEITHIEGYHYRRIGEREFTELPSLRNECWDEFVTILNNHSRDIDIHFIDSNIQPAFNKFLDDYVSALKNETNIMEETHQDVIFTADIRNIIDNIIEDRNLQNPDVFKECLVMYLNKPGDALKNYVGMIYVAIVNSDLLSRQDLVELPDMPQEEKIILFDSNVIQDLLCISDREHPLIRKSVERSTALGFGVYYFPETVDDLQRSIDGAIKEMSGLKTSSHSRETFENQFLKDWNRRYHDLNEDSMEWNEYRSYIQSWQLEVEVKYNMVQFDESIECPVEDIEFAKDVIDRADSIRHKNPKKPIVLQHDGEILAKTAKLRELTEGRHKIGPLLISLDNSVTLASNLVHEDGGWGKGIAIPPRVWFNYLLTFTSVQFTQMEVGEVILSVSAHIDSKPTLDEYSKALEVKFGLSGDSELIARYLRNTVYGAEITKSLKRDDGSADEISLTAFSDTEAIEQFTKHREHRKRIRKMGEHIQELEEENRRLREEGSGDVHQYFIGGSSEASADAQARVMIESRTELEEELSAFLDLFFETVPAEVQDDIPPAPDDTSDLERFFDWLRTATDILSNAQSSISGLTAVTRYGLLLLTAIQHFM